VTRGCTLETPISEYLLRIDSSRRVIAYLTVGRLCNNARSAGGGVSAIIGSCDHHPRWRLLPPALR
jgi:hypothetical protein